LVAAASGGVSVIRQVLEVPRGDFDRLVVADASIGTGDDVLGDSIIVSLLVLLIGQPLTCY
jgi:hypothetical protein